MVPVVPDKPWSPLVSSSSPQSFQSCTPSGLVSDAELRRDNKFRITANYLNGLEAR